MRQQTILIFGGPDGTGKTTIAKEMSKVLDIPYFKPSLQREIAISMPEVFRLQTSFGEPKLLDFLKQTGYSAVMDRGFPCDYAYSKVLERDADWGMISSLDLGYSTLNTTLVFVLRWDYGTTSEDDFKAVSDPAQRGRLEAAYRDYASWSKCDCLFLFTDPTDPKEDLRKQCNAIIQHLEDK